MKTWQKLRTYPQLWPRYFMREQVLTAIRRFFIDRSFHEVETPYLTGSLPPESYNEVFETTLLDRYRNPTRAFLPTSPEPFLKKLLVAGIGNCFALPKSFRNTETMSGTHNPEFTILEWYRVHADYRDVMKDCEELLTFINTYLLRSKKQSDASENASRLEYQGKTIDLTPPWDRMTVSESFMAYAGVDLHHALEREELAEISRKKGYKVNDADSWEVLFHSIFLNEVEPHLGKEKPLILYDYPATLAALSRKKPSDPQFAERFEFYIAGLELGDGYSELTDAKEQEERFGEEQREIVRLGKTQPPTDTDFLDALKAGMPDAGGIAVGVDRLIMLFADVTDIRDTLFFPADELFGAE